MNGLTDCLRGLFYTIDIWLPAPVFNRMGCPAEVSQSSRFFSVIVRVPITMMKEKNRIITIEIYAISPSVMPSLVLV